MSCCALQGPEADVETLSWNKGKWGIMKDCVSKNWNKGKWGITKDCVSKHATGTGHL